MVTSYIKNDNQAFEYKEGQFICHAYVPIQLSEHEEIEDLIYCISSDKSQCSSDVTSNWKRVVDDTVSSWSVLHLTLVRGHRAVYYHQIRALVSDLQSECTKFSPLIVSLDKFVIYRNFEKTKEFLCLSCSNDCCSSWISLKSSLRKVIDQYAIKLTSEDETQTTSAHCSIMYRDCTSESEDDALSEATRITNLCSDQVGSHYITSHILVKSIQMKIGKYIYELKLNAAVK